jgi:3-oxoacyl-[acyl-carrier protein] reductase
MQVFDLTGRTAIVTGAGSGIGRGTAQQLAAAGASVICADIAEDAAQATARSILVANGNATAAKVDVTCHEEVDELVRSAGRLDIMCNVAGIINDTRVVDTSEADLDRIFAVNVKGAFFGCQAAAKVMVSQGSGSIINMSSTSIDHPSPGIVCYAMSKAAVTQLTKTLAAEVGPSGVRVNAVAPGPVDTNITARHYRGPDGGIDEAKRSAVLARMTQMVPLGRMGTPEDMAYAVVYLASDAASYVTGQILRPCGGVTMPW